MTTEGTTMTLGELAQVLQAGYVVASGQDEVLASVLLQMATKATQLELAQQVDLVQGPPTSQEVISGSSDAGDGDA